MSQLEIGEVVGRGSESTIRIGRKGGKLFCLKLVEVEKGEEEKRRRVKNEVEALKRMKGHANIIQLEDSFEVENEGGSTVCLVMQLFGKFDLSSFLEKRGKVNEKEAKKIILQLISALESCHEKGIAHRDIKLQNVVIEPRKMKVKLIDFGLSAVCKEEEDLSRLKEVVGSPYYVSGEMFRGEEYDGRKTDVWSLGVLLYRLVSGKFPFDNEEQDILELCERVKRGEYEMPECSLEMEAVLRAMLEKDPKKRATLNSLKEMDWLKSRKITKRARNKASKQLDFLPSFPSNIFSCKIKQVEEIEEIVEYFYNTFRSFVNKIGVFLSDI